MPSYSAQAVHETGKVWCADFPDPGADFMSNFQIEVLKDEQHRLETFSPYSIRMLAIVGTQDRILNIRFRDQSDPPISPDIDPKPLVRITSPAK